MVLLSQRPLLRLLHHLLVRPQGLRRLLLRLLLLLLPLLLARGFAKRFRRLRQWRVCRKLANARLQLLWSTGRRQKLYNLCTIEVLPTQHRAG